MGKKRKKNHTHLFLRESRTHTGQITQTWYIILLAKKKMMWGHLTGDLDFVLER